MRHTEIRKVTYTRQYAFSAYLPIKIDGAIIHLNYLGNDAL